jgi:hypothetical protein
MGHNKKYQRFKKTIFKKANKREDELKVVLHKAHDTIEQLNIDKLG